jgi:hypothetical protein
MHSILPRACSEPFLVLWLILDMKEVSLPDRPIYCTRSHNKSERFFGFKLLKFIVLPKVIQELKKFKRNWLEPRGEQRYVTCRCKSSHGLNGVTLRAVSNKSRVERYVIFRTKKVTCLMALNYMQGPTNSRAGQKYVTCRVRVSHGLNWIT